MKAIPKVPHINARMETVSKLHLSRDAFSRRRCRIPATGFLEWQLAEDGGKQPWRCVRCQVFVRSGLGVDLRNSVGQARQAGIVCGLSLIWR